MGLARSVTKWNTACDSRLIRSIHQSKETLQTTLSSWKQYCGVQTWFVPRINFCGSACGDRKHLFRVLACARNKQQCLTAVEKEVRSKRHIGFGHNVGAAVDPQVKERTNQSSSRKSQTKRLRWFSSASPLTTQGIADDFEMSCETLDEEDQGFTSLVVLSSQVRILCSSWVAQILWSVDSRCDRISHLKNNSEPTDTTKTRQT